MSSIATGTEPRLGKSGALLRRLPWHALTTFFIRILAAGLTYGVQILLARTLGEHDYGIFSLAWVWVMLGGYLGCLGLSQSAVRFLPGYRELGRHDLARGFFNFSLFVTSVMSLALTAVVIGGLAFAQARGWLDPAYHWPLLLGALCLPIFAFQDLLEGFARARGKMLAAFVPPYILRGLFLVGMTFLLLRWGYAASATTAMAAAFCATFLAALVQAMLVLPSDLAESRAVAAKAGEKRQWIRATVPLFLADGALILRQYVDVLLLGLLVQPAILGIYFAVSRLVALLGLVEYSVGAMFGRKFSIAAATHDQVALGSMLRQSTVLVFWPTLLGAIALIFLAPFLLSFFGAEFVSGAAIVSILVIGPVIRALAGSSEEMLNMLGYGSYSLRAHVLALLAGAVSLLLLVPFYGMTGAAIAASLASGLNGLILGAYVYRKTGHLALPWPAAAGRGSVS